MAAKGTSLKDKLKAQGLTADEIALHLERAYAVTQAVPSVSISSYQPRPKGLADS